MKIIFTIFLLFLSAISFSQSWTSEEKAILNQYNLSESDHRGIQFTSNQNERLSFLTLKEALLYFLENKNVTDITKMHVQQYPKNQNLLDAIINIKEIIDHYLLLSK